MLESQKRPKRPEDQKDLRQSGPRRTRIGGPHLATKEYSHAWLTTNNPWRFPSSPFFYRGREWGFERRDLCPSPRQRICVTPPTPPPLCHSWLTTTNPWSFPSSPFFYRGGSETSNLTAFHGFYPSNLGRNPNLWEALSSFISIEWK